MTPLLESNIFNWTFDFDEWPATHYNVSTQMRGFNQSYFKLRYNYPAVFKKIHAAKDKPNAKVYKIKYNLNIIPSMSEKDGQIIEAIANSNELEIFKTKVVKDLVKFKWDQFGYWIHMIMFMVHLLK